MSRSERRAMIVRDHPALSLSRQCRLLSVGRSSLYYEPKGENAEMLSYSAPPGYGFTGIVDAILEADADPEAPRKQFPILGPESTLASRAALASRARGLYMSMIAPMACPTRSAAASISRSPRWA